MDTKISESIAQDIIKQLKSFCERHSVSSLFVVGSYPRYLYMKDAYDAETWKSNTIEISSIYFEDIKYLGYIFATEVLNVVPTYNNDKKSVSMSYKDIVVEFQSNSTQSYMNNQSVLTWMNKNKIDIAPLIHNAYGRDFTLNTLVLSIDNNNIYDPLNRAVKDIDKELISSILPPHILIKNNPRAIIDAIKLSLLLDFFIDNSLSLVMADSTSLLFQTLSQKRVINHVIEILNINPVKGLDLLKRYNLDKVLLSKEIKELVYDVK